MTEKIKNNDKQKDNFKISDVKINYSLNKKILLSMIFLGATAIVTFSYKNKLADFLHASKNRIQNIVDNKSLGKNSLEAEARAFEEKYNSKVEAVLNQAEHSSRVISQAQILNPEDQYNNREDIKNQSIIKFAPEEEMFDHDEDLISNPYEDLHSDELKKIDIKVIKQNLIHHVDTYRIYLANANKMIAKFMQDKSFNEELTILKRKKLPTYINDIIKLLDEYNIILLEPRLSDEKILLFDSKFISKFIKITKKTDSLKNHYNFKEKIIDKIEILNDYLYSPELQSLFIK